MSWRTGYCHVTPGPGRVPDSVSRSVTRSRSWYSTTVKQPDLTSRTRALQICAIQVLEYSQYIMSGFLTKL